MRTAFLLSLFLGAAIPLFAQAPAPAQTPPKPAPATPTSPPARPRATRRAPASTARSGIAMVVTDQRGAPLGSIHVDMMGPAARSGDTDMSGQVNFPGLQSGTYRLRFSGDGVATFEREVTVRAGAIEHLDIKLSPVAAPKAPEPATPATPAAGPTGSPQIGSLTNLADRMRNSKTPARETLLSCSGNTRNVLLVLTDEQPDRLYTSAESTYYVISGQGGAKVGAIQSVISPGSFVAVPRGTTFSIARQGKNPLVMLWTLSGEPCDEAR
jgi:mannose-6-phosphate isomerase-like protein (cupin superfamily)